MIRVAIPAAVVLWGIAGAFHEAAAQQAAPDDPVAVVERLMRMPLGAPRSFFEKRIKDEITASFRARIRAARDPVERDRLRRRLPEAIRAFEATWVAFGPGKTPYDHSVVAGEFLHDGTDGLLKRLDGQREWYYFFHDGKLWKIVVTIPPTYDFGAAALRLTKRLGVPESIALKAGAPSRALDRVRWERSDAIIELADRRVDFACYTATIARADIWRQRARRGSSGRGLELDPLVRDAIGQPAGSSRDQGQPANAGSKPERRPKRSLPKKK